MIPVLQRAWLRLHRWLAFTVGVLLVLAGLLGALLVLARPLDRLAHPELFRQAVDAARASPTPLEDARRRLAREFGPRAGYTFRPPRQADDTLWVFVRGPWEGIVYFDAAGRELGRRGEHEGPYNLLFELHSTLLLGDAGRAVLATAAGGYLVLLLAGLVLWWPRRWPPSFRVHWRAGVLRGARDLHNATGVLLAVPMAVSIASGAYMAWPPLRTLVTQAAGGTAVQPPKPAPSGPATGFPLDAMVRTARTLFPQAMVGYVQVPAGPARPVRIRLKLPDDPHPNGLTSVWLHPGNGSVLQVARWDSLDAGNRLVATLYPLHTGALGGPLHEGLVGLTGLALATAGGAGWLLWWKRRKRRTPSPLLRCVKDLNANR